MPATGHCEHNAVIGRCALCKKGTQPKPNPDPKPKKDKK